MKTLNQKNINTELELEEFLGYYSSGPDRCFFCEEIINGESYEILADTDPGDAEVGPQPCIETVCVCNNCHKN